MAEGLSLSFLSHAPFWVWWLPPVLVTVVVAVIAALVRRERRRPVDTVRSVEDYARFRQALAESEPGRPAGRFGRLGQRRSAPGHARSGGSR